MIRKLIGYLPWYKWCGCSLDVTHDESYQFRVRSDDENGEFVFQIRQKRICNECDSENITVPIESTCNYDPQDDYHERRVGVDENDMVDYGFMSQDEMARLLIEMRLSDALTPQISED